MVSENVDVQCPKLKVNKLLQRIRISFDTINSAIWQ